MTWFLVDDGFAFHPKATEAGNAALGLWVRSGAWCNAHLTDGFVPKNMIATLGGQRREAERLVRSGLWRHANRTPSQHETNTDSTQDTRAIASCTPDGTHGECGNTDGYVFHQWSQRQSTKEKVEKVRKQNRIRQNTWREKNRNDVDDSVSNGVTNADTRNDSDNKNNGVTNASSNGVTNGMTNNAHSTPLHATPTTNKVVDNQLPLGTSDVSDADPFPDDGLTARSRANRTTPEGYVADTLHVMTNGALSYVAMKPIAKWALASHDGLTPRDLGMIMERMYKNNRAVTKQSLGSVLQGFSTPERGQPNAAQRRMNESVDIVDYFAQMETSQRQEIEQ